MSDHPDVDGQCSWPACEQSARHKIGEEGPVSMHNMTAYLCCEHMSALHMNCQQYPYAMALRSPFGSFDPSTQSFLVVSPEVARLIEAVGADNLPALLRALHDTLHWQDASRWGIGPRLLRRLGEALDGDA